MNIATSQFRYGLSSSLMKAITVSSGASPGKIPASALTLSSQVPVPSKKPHELLVAVSHFALNRMDILQRQGLYPPPPGASHLIGVEIAGRVLESADGSTWKKDDLVFGLIPGGGYAEFATIHEKMAMSIPPHLSPQQAVAIPEAFFTAYQSLVTLAKLQKHERVLIHAGASGVGTAAIQLAKHVIGADSVIVTVGSEEKARFCKELGATDAILYKEQDFADTVLDITRGQGVNVVLDFIGSSYLQKHFKVLALDGRLVTLGFMGGHVLPDNVSIAPMLRKRITWIGSTLRSRSTEYQISLKEAFERDVLHFFEEGVIKPVIDREFDWSDITKAHEYMESNASIGKIIVKTS